MTVWPGDPEFSLEPDSRMLDGASCNTSVLRLSTHTGTHCDAPWHFIDGGQRLHEVDTSVFFGEAAVIACSGVDTVHADDLGPGPLPERILLRTRNSEFAPDTPFRKDFTGVAEDAARRIAEEGVRLAGIDYLSIAPYKASGPTHRILLENGVFIVEGLLLGDVAPGTYPFVVLPLPVRGADGAPCRAFIGLREDSE
jgi:arylformamidase